MSARIGSYIRRHHVGLIAIFLILGGGTAYAVDGPNPGQNTIGSEDIIGNEVKSDDIGNGRIFNLDIADEIITGQKLKDGTVTGSDVDEASLNLGIGRSDIGTNCFDDDQNGENRVAVTFTLADAGRVLVVGRTSAVAAAFDDTSGPGSSGDTSNLVTGHCELRINSSLVPGTLVPISERDNAGTGLSSLPAGQDVTTSGVSGSFSAGAHTAVLICTEDDGDMDFLNSKLSVAALDEG